MTRYKDFKSSLFFFILGVGFLLYSSRYALGDLQSPGPGLFPMVVGALFTILALAQTLQALIKLKRGNQDEAVCREALGWKDYFEANPGEARVLGGIVVFILYLLAIQFIGFFVANFFFIVTVSRLALPDGWLKTLVFAVLFNIFCWQLFEVWLKISFPRGMLF